MANKKFTEQEMLTLRNSKYVLDVSPSIVHFSAEFKKLFWEELSKGRLPREIVLSNYVADMCTKWRNLKTKSSYFLLIKIAAFRKFVR